MGSGVIYAVIVVMWAAYFIPRWLRRHEELSESRSVEKFSDAMRILSRREPTPDQRYVVMPPRPDEPRERRRRRRRPIWARSAKPTTSSALAVRRRRILVALVLATMLGAIAALVGLVPWWACAVPAVLLLVDLVHLRVQARRQRELRRSRQAVRRRTRARLRRLDSAERIVASRRGIAEERAIAEEARLAAERAEAERREAELTGWQPTPVPLPTYVSKPKATRPARMVDLSVPAAGEPGAAAPPFLEEEPFDQAASAPEPALLEDEAGELDAIIERRRAVND